MATEFTVRNLFEDRAYKLGLELLGGDKGLDNPIRVPRVQKPGLALAGYADQIRPYRLQVLGATEMNFLSTLPEKLRDVAVSSIFKLDVACFVVSKGLELPQIFVKEADRTNIPLLRTKIASSVLIERVERFMETSLAPTTMVHGVLVDVLEVGILLLGKSGIGKSECAMDLILRGHRLVADDVVRVSRIPPFRLSCRGEGLIRYHMEVRGLGILSIKDLFGNVSVKDQKDLDLVIELVDWDEAHNYDRLGFDEETYRIHDVDVPFLRIPVAPGRNIASVVEVAARNHQLKQMGENSAIKLKKKLEQAILEGSK